MQTAMHCIYLRQFLSGVFYGLLGFAHLEICVLQLEVEKWYGHAE